MQSFSRLPIAITGTAIASLMASAFLTALTPTTAHAQTTLSGVTIFQTNNQGSYNNADFWNTQGNDPYYNLWISMNGTALNGPTDALAAINTSLAVPGTYEFTMFGNSAANGSFYGMNLFFNGNSGPSISVFAPLATTASTPGFSANSSTTTPNVTFATTPGAGTVTFVSGGNQVTLTNYRWESSTVQNQDLVSPFSRTSGSGADNQGSFTLRVTSLTAVPEPGEWATMGIGIMGLSGLMLRARRRISK